MDGGSEIEGTQEAQVLEFPRPSPRANRNPKGSILMAAMIGLADALGLDEAKQDEIAVVADTPEGEGGLTLMFGPLDPLD